jgi:WD40 repeat protein
LRLWRLSNGAMLPLSGYTERVRSFTWTPDGAYLVTSGAERVILWPAPEEGGRLYSVPVLVAPNRARSVAVAAHPHESFIAAGYADGLVLLVRLTDAAELVIKHPDGSPVSALLWTAAGVLAIASENGSARIIQFE